ncbi:5-formyltetrahydrofolate cyclo-ligase [Halalkalibacter alkalisediminis]|uniref:5-formyltetrahydrofolate cyclo-ligase n=1 Tax=Halalkalibacter alkalisediminis TaxID=935616 RepID=A0ABV6NBE4_9BACI|nr:5-formyltetrahydrofolate cyclo-ligase [Halalkalibacter alkalisediminis]
MKIKQSIRKQVVEKLKHLTNEQYIKQSAQIAQHLFDSRCWKKAQLIAITIPRDQEVDTYEIIKMGWKQNKIIAVPRADFKTKTMTFYELTSFDKLEESAFRVKEPKESLCRTISKEEIGLVIVPGVAFDKRGYRLGYGGGFYDRFLPQIKVPTIALAFTCQLVKEVPIDIHDWKIDHIISPMGFYR